MNTVCLHVEVRLIMGMLTGFREVPCANILREVSFFKQTIAWNIRNVPFSLVIFIGVLVLFNLNSRYEVSSILCMYHFIKFFANTNFFSFFSNSSRLKWFKIPTRHLPATCFQSNSIELVQIKLFFSYRNAIFHITTIYLHVLSSWVWSFHVMLCTS